MTVQGYYLNCDDAVCTDCLPAGFSSDNPVGWEGFEGWPEPLVIFSDSESDSVTHCVECGAVLETNLTDVGYGGIMDAVREGFSEGKQSPVVVLWLNTYAQWDDELGAMDEYYRLLPHDPAWTAREDLQRYVRLAGWETSDVVG